VAPTLTSPFFRPGGTLPLDTPSYIQRKADEDLYASLKRGEFCYILASRQIGKSSLMIQVAAHLRREGVQVAVLDLNAIGHAGVTAEQWYYSLLLQLGERLGQEEALEDFWRNSPQPTPLQKWIAAIRYLTRNQQSLVIFLDEIDQVRALPFPTDDFFAAIRSCYNRRADDPAFAQLTFCLIGSALPSELVRDPRLTPFNVGRRIELYDFTAEEINALVSGLGREELVAEALLARVYHWTAGHPYLTQRLCREIVDHAEIGSGEQVDALCHRLFFSLEAREQDDNLKFVEYRLLHSEEDIAGILTLYAAIYRQRTLPQANVGSLMDALELAGIIRSDQGRVAVRNRIYERVFDLGWVREHMPDAELRRQRAAYRRGRQRAAMVSTAILGTMLCLYLNALHNAAVARQQTRLAQQQSALARQRAEEANTARGQATASAHQAEQNAHNALSFSHVAVKAEKVALWAQHLADVRTQDALAAVAREAAARRSEQTARLAEASAKNDALYAAGRARRSAEYALKQRDAAQRLLYIADMSLIQRAWEGDDIGRIRDLLDETRIYRERGFEWGYWHRLCHLDAVTLAGHTSGVLRAAYSPDGSRVVTAGYEGVVKVWDVQTGKQLLSFAGIAKNQAITSIAYSPDGKTIIARGSPLMMSDKVVVRAWDARSGQELFSHHPPPAPTRPPFLVPPFAYSPDGQHMVAGALISKQVKTPSAILMEPQWTAQIWDLGTGKEYLVLRGETGSLMFSAYSAAGDRIVTTGLTVKRGPVTKIWRANNGAELCTLQNLDAPLKYAAFSPDARYIVAGSDSPAARVWDARTGKELSTLSGHAETITSAAFSPDSGRIVTGSTDQTVRVWDVQTGRAIQTYKGHSGVVSTVAFSPDGQHVISGADDRTARIWDLNGQGEATNLPTVNLCLSPDGSMACTRDGSDLIHIWDVATGRQIHLIKGKQIAGLTGAFSPDGRMLAVDDLDGTVRVWNVATGAQLLALPGPQNYKGTPGYNDIAFSPDGKAVLALNRLYGLRLWDVHNGRELLSLSWDNNMGNAFAFSPDGSRIAARISDSVAKVWDTHTGSELHTLTGASEALAYSPDGKRIVGGSDKGVTVWDALIGREILALKGPRGGWAIGFSPDGTRIASGGDRVVTVWDVRTGRELFTLNGHPGGVGSVVFSKDGTRILSSDNHGTIKLWDALIGRELLTLKADTNRIRTALFSPDGKRIVCEEAYGHVKSWSSDNVR
jgi:WD40 repeat protein